MGNIRILRKCQVQIDRSDPEGHCLASRGYAGVMLNYDPSDRFVYQYLALMIDSFSCILVGDGP